VIELRRALDGLLDLSAGSDGGPAAVLASLLMAVFIGQAIAWIYLRTHHGLSYSKGFTQSLVVLAVASSLLVHVIGDSLVTAFGLLGALAIVRFRNVLKDTRDTVYVLVSLILGMATGTERFDVALLGALVLIAVFVYLHLMSFGSKGHFDGHLTYVLDDDETGRVRERVEEVLGAYCRGIHQEARHELGEALEIVSTVLLRDPERSSELVRHLRGVPGVRSAQLVVHDVNVEM